MVIQFLLQLPQHKKKSIAIWIPSETWIGFPFRVQSKAFRTPVDTCVQTLWPEPPSVRPRLRQIKTAQLRDVVLVRPAPAYHVRRSTWTDTPLPPDEPLGTNPPAGAVIDFFLPHDAKGPVTLEVLDSKRELVRRFRSDDPLEPSSEELARELIPRYWIALPHALPARSGMHRWIWDLRYAAPLTTTRGYPISAVPHATPRTPEGPVAVPGSYIVRLTVDGHSLEAPLTLAPDPRVRLPASALEDQLRLARKLADQLSAASHALLMATSEREQLKTLAPAASTAEAVGGYAARLSALLDTAESPEHHDAAQEKKEAAPSKEDGQSEVVTQPTLPDVQKNLDTLYTEVTRADAAPTGAQLKASEAAQEALSGLLRAWQQLQADLPALNAYLRAHNLSQIRADLPPPRDLNAADEE